MAKMVLRELMDPLIFLKFKSFLMKVQHASPPTTTTFFVFLKSFWINQSRTWWNFCFLALHLWIRSSFSSLISTSFLKTGIHWQSLYLLNMKKNPIVSSCTTHHMLVLILRSCTGILSVNCVTKFLFYGWVQGNDPSCLREFLLQILSRNSPSGNVGLQVSSTNANYHTLSYTFHNIYKDCFL
jgi:hypothetical protein